MKNLHCGGSNASWSIAITALAFQTKQARVSILATVAAVVVGFTLSAFADERPSDPFGNHTTEINKEPLSLEYGSPATPNAA